MFERFARAARTAVEDAQYEAERRGDRRVSTEHLLVALLEDASLAGAVGSDAQSVRDAGDRLDAAALAAIGVELDAVGPSGRPTRGGRVPFTSGAKAVLQGALARAAAEKARTISGRHLLLAILDRRAPDPAAVLLESLSVDPIAVRARLSAAA